MKNEILEEQRKARKQYLELKKIQQGEATPPPKPSEQAAANPLSFTDKIKNFWTYYKWHTIGIIVAAAVIIVSVSECVNRVKPDMSVVFFTYQGITEQQTDSLVDYMEGICEDINGDGQVFINTINCSYDPKGNDGQYEFTVLNKLQAILAADYEALLFITDTESYQYFLGNNSMKGLFTGEPVPFSESLCEKLSTADIKFYGENMQISCRTYYNTVLEGDKTSKAIYEQAQKIIEKIAVE